MASNKDQAGKPAAYDRKAMARRVLDAFSTGNTKIIDELFHANFLSHSEPFPGVDATREGLKREIQQLREAFPDAKFTADSVTEDGDSVTIHWTMTGTQEQPILGVPPSRQPITQTGQEILKFHGNQIIGRVGRAEHHEFHAKLRDAGEKARREGTG
ncbi:MAG TPA: ester cyclase [Gemmatimonadaceae bacterium]|jgi:predicted ester cyclase|nr:ester cyclase [Gemmatimonadaceae bacterium]